MKNDTHTYSDEPMQFTIIEDFLPPPEALAAAIKRREQQKVTLNLDADSVAFFKACAERYDVPYQAMIRELLEQYAQAARKSQS